MKYIKLLLILLLIQCTEATQDEELKDKSEVEIPNNDSLVTYDKEPIEVDTFEDSTAIELKSDIESAYSWHSADYRLRDFDLQGKVRHVDNTLHSIHYDENNEKYISNGDRIRYAFNQRGFLIKESVFNSGDTLKWHTTYNYDSKGNLVKKSIIHEKGWGTDFSINYQYNKKGLLVKEVNTSQHLGNISYEYDTLGKILKQKYFSEENTVTKTAYYSYSTEGNIDSVITKTNSGEILSKQFYKYNEMSNIIERYSEGQPVNCAGRNKWFYTYNSVGHVKKEKTHDLTVNYVYHYDRVTNWTSKTSYYGDKPNFITRRQIEYY